MNILRKKHGNGHVLVATTEEGNTLFSGAKKEGILKAICANDTKGVYVRVDGRIVCVLTNGAVKKMSYKDGEYIFI